MELAPAHKRSDPVTSSLADREITESGKRLTRSKFFAELVGSYEGHTSSEIAHMFDADRYERAKRLSDARGLNLVKNGENKRCDVSGKLAMTWWNK